MAYHKFDKTFDSDIFSTSALKDKLGVNAMESQKLLYDLVVVDSQGVEMNFAQALEHQNEVIVYIKQLGNFYINTPAGHYNPDWEWYSRKIPRESRMNVHVVTSLQYLTALPPTMW